MINNIFENIEHKIPMAVVRFGDGEKNIIDNIPCQRKGFFYHPNNFQDLIFRDNLIESLRYYGGKNYLIGIDDDFLEKEVKGNIISPMIFVNQNYLVFLEKLKKVTKEIPTVLVINKKSKLTNLPISFMSIFGLDNNAWRTANNLHLRILDWIKRFDSPLLLLVAGGAYSCVLIHKIWKQNQKHMLLDIGSTLDPFLFGQKTRKYQDRLNK